MHVKTEHELRELMAFYLELEKRMQLSGRLLIALHARGQYRRYRWELTGSWKEVRSHAG
ncbi:hypothetical protein D3C74_238730 [compost metagenome]